MGGCTRALLVVGALPGCAVVPECETTRPWSEVEVSVEAADPERQGALELRTQQALDTFVRWTDREQTCVSSVSLVPTLESDNVAGNYDHRSGAINALSTLDDPWQTLFHELCHGLDHLDDIANAWPDTFPAEAVARSDSYPTREIRRRERFAQRCAEGAWDVGRWRTWEQTCGLPHVDEALEPHEVVQAEAFGGAERPPWDAPTVLLERGERRVQSDPSDGLSWLAIEATRQQAVVLYAHVGSGTHLVTFIDPWTGRVEHSYPLDLCGGRSPCTSTLHSDGTRVLLSTRTPEGVQLRLLSTDGAEVVAPACLAGPPEMLADGAIWRVLHDTEGDTWIEGCDLSTGEARGPLTVPRAFPHTKQGGIAHNDPLLPIGYGQRVGDRPGVWDRDASLVWWPEADGPWEATPLAEHLAIRELAPLADGRLLLLIQGASDLDGTPRITLVWLDPATGVMETPDDPCPLLEDNPQAVSEAVAGDGWALLVLDAHVPPELLPLRWR